MSTATRRQQIFTGVAAVLILALAFWLLLGRSPGGTAKREVDLGTAVPTDAGTVTVTSLEPVAEGTPGAPSPDAGHEVRGIRFRSCRNGTKGPVVDLSLFSVQTADGRLAGAAGSRESELRGDCTAGTVYVQVPTDSSPSDVEYAADPLAVWRLPAA